MFDGYENYAAGEYRKGKGKSELTNDMGGSNF
jgi:hypothetical protein